MTKANFFLASSWVGLAGLLVAYIGATGVLAPTIRPIGALIAVLACWAMLVTRNADEYTRALWNTGASLAFATVLVLYIGLPFAEGLYDGLRSDETSRRDIPAGFGVTIGIAAFFVGHAWKRLRGV